MNTPRPIPGPEIYEGIEKLAMPHDVQGWHSQHSVFDRLISEASPAVIIEVGSWKGASAIHMADITHMRFTQSKIYCVDTWLGGIDHELHQEVETSVLQREHGYPGLYFQFLTNVYRAGFKDRIVPIPQTSINGARFLHAHGVVADLIYIDGSHEYPDALIDMDMYWKLLRPGGIMFGDDIGFDGVARSIAEFCKHTGLTCEIIADNFWVLRKPASTP